MKKIDLGQTITILANVGVIAGIVFLGIEIRQNSEMMQSQTRQDISSSTIELQRWLASDLEILYLYRRAQLEPEGLTELEQMRWGSIFGSIMRTWENIHFQYRRELLEDGEYFAEREVWRSAFEKEWIRGVYCAGKHSSSPEFVVEVQSMMPSTKCRPNSARGPYDL